MTYRMASSTLRLSVSDIASMNGETIRHVLVLHLADLHHATILTYFDPFDNILSEHILASGKGGFYVFFATLGGYKSKISLTYTNNELDPRSSCRSLWFWGYFNLARLGGLSFSAASIDACVGPT